MHAYATVEGTKSEARWKVSLVVVWLFFSEVNVWIPREGLKEWMRPKASKVWGKSIRLAASRVCRTRCHELALTDKHFWTGWRSI